MRSASKTTCNRRRTLGWLGAAILATTAGACSTITSLFKASKQEANYQNMPRNGQQCAGCSHFIPPDGCGRVEGPVSPNGWCRFWSARSG